VWEVAIIYFCAGFSIERFAARKKADSYSLRIEKKSLAPICSGRPDDFLGEKIAQNVTQNVAQNVAQLVFYRS
jgi:hypothetical protein